LERIEDFTFLPDLEACFLAAALPLAVYGNFFEPTFGISSSFVKKN
tara:strand:+ start:757 stop:894 length:138 start_codon:yes stop_codon:yes gene_type:complete